MPRLLLSESSDLLRFPSLTSYSHPSLPVPTFQERNIAGWLNTIWKLSGTSLDAAQIDISRLLQTYLKQVKMRAAVFDILLGVSNRSAGTTKTSIANDSTSTLTGQRHHHLDSWAVKKHTNKQHWSGLTLLTFILTWINKEPLYCRKGCWTPCHDLSFQSPGNGRIDASYRHTWDKLVRKMQKTWFDTNNLLLIRMDMIPSASPSPRSSQKSWHVPLSWRTQWSVPFLSLLCHGQRSRACNNGQQLATCGPLLKQ